MGYELESVSIDPPQDGKLGGTRGTISPPSFQERLRNRGHFEADEIDVVRDEITKLLMGEMAEAQLHGRRYRLDPRNVDDRKTDETEVMGRLGALSSNRDQADVVLEEIQERVELVIWEHWRCVERLADARLERRTLTGYDAAAIIGCSTGRDA